MSTQLSPEEQYKQWIEQQAAKKDFRRDFPEIPTVNIEDITQAIGSLEGPKTMDPNRPYVGQLHTDTGKRGSTEVKGVTFRDVRDCFIRAYILSHSYNVYDEVKREYTMKRQEPNASLIDEANKGDKAHLNGNDVYNLVGTIDPIAVAQNLSCEIEKMMGIFPNIPEHMKSSSVFQLSEPDQSPTPPCDNCSLKECDDKSSY